MIANEDILKYMQMVLDNCLTNIYLRADNDQSPNENIM